MPDIDCGTLVNVAGTVSTGSVSVTGMVAVGVNGVGLGEAVAVMVAVDVMVVVAVAVVVPLVGVAEIVNETVEVLEGRGLLVVVAVRLGVWDGSGLGWIVSVAVGVDVAATAALADGRPVPIKITRIPAKNRSAIPLKKIP